MSKFLEIEVTRRIGTTLYVEVPDNFDIKLDIEKINLKLAAAETVNKHEWEDEPGFPYEICSAKEVPPVVAQEYAVHVHN